MIDALQCQDGKPGRLMRCQRVRWHRHLRWSWKGKSSQAHACHDTARSVDGGYTTWSSGVWFDFDDPRWHPYLWISSLWWKDCRVFLGSHGCKRRRGHRGKHRCCRHMKWDDTEQYAFGEDSLEERSST